MPIWTAESSSPGVTVLPPASITRAPSGALDVPTETIRPPRMTMVPLAIGGPDTGRIRALVIATISPLRTGAGRGGAAEDAAARTTGPGTRDATLAAAGTAAFPSWKSLRGAFEVSARS